MKNIIGFSCFYHDSAAAYIRDGEIICAVQEERFSRIKHDNSFPENSINYILASNKLELNDTEELIKKAEKKEQESNQIVEFTKEIKKYTMEFRHKIIEILWKIVYSDRTNNIYESNLIRRVCGLLYVSDKDSGEIKLKVKNYK